MYDKTLARHVFRVLKKKAKHIMQSKDPFDSAITATEMYSLLDLFADVIKLDCIETININITKEG